MSGIPFDDLPQTRKPNPLPCGCGIMGIRGINLEGTREEFRDLHIRFCPLHGAAPDLLAELKHLVRLLEPVEDTLNVPGLATLNGAREAIRKAEGTPE